MPTSLNARNDTADIIDVSELLEDDAFEDVVPVAVDQSPEGLEHGLFLDRLEQFMVGQEESLKAFAVREGKPLEFIKRHVALAHSKFLFNKPMIEGSGPQAEEGPAVSVRAMVARICSTLDSLQSLCHYESLLLVANPRDQDKSYVGGTRTGKSFWDSLSRGGRNGVKAFKQHCKTQTPLVPATNEPVSPGKRCKNSLKAELNTAMRIALRNASGNTSAEMRWTRPEQIENWGVRIAGWPSDVPFRNPSNNTVQVNTRILTLLRAGKIKFVKPGDLDWDAALSTSTPAEPVEPPIESGSNVAKAIPPSQPPVPIHGGPIRLVPPVQITAPSAVPNSYVLIPGNIDTNELLRIGVYPGISPGIVDADVLRRQLGSNIVTLPLAMAAQNTRGGTVPLAISTQSTASGSVPLALAEQNAPGVPSKGSQTGAAPSVAVMPAPFSAPPHPSAWHSQEITMPDPVSTDMLSGNIHQVAAAQPSPTLIVIPQSIPSVEPIADPSRKRKRGEHDQPAAPSPPPRPQTPTPMLTENS